MREQQAVLQQVQLELGASDLQGVSRLWGGNPRDPAPPPRVLDMETFALEARQRSAVRSWGLVCCGGHLGLLTAPYLVLPTVTYSCLPSPTVTYSCLLSPTVTYSCLLPPGVTGCHLTMPCGTSCFTACVQRACHPSGCVYCSNGRGGGDGRVGHGL